VSVEAVLPLRVAVTIVDRFLVTRLAKTLKATVRRVFGVLPNVTLEGRLSRFGFEAENGKIQGDEISMKAETRLRVRSPVPARIVILKDGVIWTDETGIATKEIPVTQPGVYRTEIYLPQLGNLPWIISNPVYVR